MEGSSEGTPGPGHVLGGAVAPSSSRRWPRCGVRGGLDGLGALCLRGGSAGRVKPEVFMKGFLLRAGRSISRNGYG